MNSLTEIMSALRAGKVTSEQLVTDCLATIESKKALNAVLETYRSALTMAREIDARRASGEELPPLAGIPMLVKDNILVQGEEATAGSNILKGHQAAYDATVIARLRAQGVIFIGRTNMDEFAMGSSNETSAYGPVQHPMDPTRIPGGSSGGSAAAVAADLAPIALGSDTGGSIRQPAALCGVVGLKPTYGRVSRYGLIALASSLDQIGTFTHTVRDAAYVMAAMEGVDENDATSVQTEAIIPELLQANVKGLRIGIPEEYFVEGMDEEIRKNVMGMAKKMEAAGAELVKISLPMSKHALEAYYVIMPCEASSNLARLDGMRYGATERGASLIETYAKSRSAGFGAEAKRRILLGTFALSHGYRDAYYKKALAVRALIRKEFEDAFKSVDVILSPTSPSVAWKAGEKFNDPIAMYLSDIYTVSANLAGIPALSVPCGTAHGLPVGVQLMAPWFGEKILYEAGMWVEGEGGSSR